MQHTVKEYEAELARLRERILLMGAEVERSVEIAIDALRKMDPKKAGRVIDGDQEIDNLEVEIHEMCFRLLVRRQPMANDLRFVMSALRLVTDLERTADLAVNICERVRELSEQTAEVPLSRSLTHMAEVAFGQLHDALDAVVRGSPGQAEVVVGRDATVDVLYAQLFPELIAHMVSSPQSADIAMRQQSIGKCIERIADHATNIAEAVVFIVQGKDIRHHHSGTEHDGNVSHPT